MAIFHLAFFCIQHPRNNYDLITVIFKNQYLVLKVKVLYFDKTFQRRKNYKNKMGHLPQMPCCSYAFVFHTN